MRILSLVSVLLIIQSINSKSIENDDCSVCKFDDDFNPSTGYGCFSKIKNETMCTCPDHLQTTINRPCRICERINICGSNGLCSEKFLISNRTKQRNYFACFCRSNVFVMNDKCPDDSSNNTSPTVVPSLNTTQTTVFIGTTATTNPIVNENTTITTTPTVCGNNSSHLNLFIEPFWIILLNLVYFINK